MKTLPIILLAAMILCSGCGKAKEWVVRSQIERTFKLAEKYRIRLETRGVSNFVVDTSYDSKSGSVPNYSPDLHVTSMVGRGPDWKSSPKIMAVFNKDAVSKLPKMKGMKFDYVLLVDPQLKDLSLLKGITFESLSIKNASVTDLFPLKGKKLKYLTFIPKNITNGMDVIRNMTSLEFLWIDQDTSGGISHADFWKRFDAGEFE